jgi:hypothetical protein
VNKQGSPGYPYCLTHTTNAAFIDFYGPQKVYQMVLQRVDALMKDPSSEAASDPVRLFVKQDAHTKEKADLKRWRLIWSISIIDQLVDRILWKEYIDNEVINCDKLPSKVGWAFLKGGQEQIYRELYRLGKRYAKSDKSSWDWTVSYWLARWVQLLKFRLCVNDDPDSFWHRLAEARHETLFCHRRIIFSDGFEYKQLIPGIIPSGFYRTLSDNSQMQVILKVLVHYIDGHDNVKWEDIMMDAWGDDDLGLEGLVKIERFKEIINSLGFIFKEIKVTSNLLDLSVCSRGMKMLPNGKIVPIPENWEKHQYNLVMREEKSDKSEFIDNLDALMLEYAFVPEIFDKLRKVMIREAPKERIRSREWYQNMITGYESAESRTRRVGDRARTT